MDRPTKCAESIWNALIDGMTRLGTTWSALIDELSCSGQRPEVLRFGPTDEVKCTVVIDDMT